MDNSVNNKDFLYKFVQNFPYPSTRFHNLWETRKTLNNWMNEFPDKVPQTLLAEPVYKAHLLYRAGFAPLVDPMQTWLNWTYNGEEVHWDTEDAEFSIYVEPDGVYVRHKGYGSGDCWTDWEREGD